jgi:hypothetical protein
VLQKKSPSLPLVVADLYHFFAFHVANLDYPPAADDPWGGCSKESLAQFFRDPSFYWRSA